MIKIPTKIEIKPSPGKGFGVFAIEEIKKGEIIEECYAIEVDNIRHPSNLQRYLFDYKGLRVIPLGYGAVYNHDSSNNADWKLHSSFIGFQFYAIRDILPKEEIYLNYKNSEFSS